MSTPAPSTEQLVKALAQHVSQCWHDLSQRGFGLAGIEKALNVLLAEEGHSKQIIDAVWRKISELKSKEEASAVSEALSSGLSLAEVDATKRRLDEVRRNPIAHPGIYETMGLIKKRTDIIPADKNKAVSMILETAGKTITSEAVCDAIACVNSIDETVNSIDMANIQEKLQEFREKNKHSKSKIETLTDTIMLKEINET